ncbi:MAG: class I SAM-dependent methyltransferase [Proteobacteria bacterium]|nr:class I SAM-dependent methyltransferase [Pseudomonadota bacterium]
MAKVDFDEYAENYNEILEGQLAFFDKENDYFSEYKVSHVKDILNSTPASILEYGCGIGRNLRFFQKYFAGSRIYACDVSEKSLDIAQKNNPGVNFFKVGEEPEEEGFDLVFVAGVFHHVSVKDRSGVAEHISSVLSKDGRVCIFEHNPYNPLTRWLVSTCPFDEDAVLLKPSELKDLLQTSGMKVQPVEYTLFFPNFLKWLRPFERWLTKLPLGGQYLITGKRVDSLASHIDKL